MRESGSTASQLSLPMTAVFTVQQAAEYFIARALDFDLVAVGPTYKEALLKLRVAVKAHIEFGIKNGLCKEDIAFSSPEEYWNILTAESSIQIGEPIEVDGTKIRTMVRNSENDTSRNLIAA